MVGPAGQDPVWAQPARTQCGLWAQPSVCLCRQLRPGLSGPGPPPARRSRSSPRRRRRCPSVRGQVPSVVVGPPAVPDSPAAGAGLSRGRRSRGTGPSRIFSDLLGSAVQDSVWAQPSRTQCGLNRLQDPVWLSRLQDPVWAQPAVCRTQCGLSRPSAVPSVRHRDRRAPSAGPRPASPAQT